MHGISGSFVHCANERAASQSSSALCVLHSYAYIWQMNGPCGALESAVLAASSVAEPSGVGIEAGAHAPSEKSVQSKRRIEIG